MGIFGLCQVNCKSRYWVGEVMCRIQMSWFPAIKISGTDISSWPPRNQLVLEFSYKSLQPSHFCPSLLSNQYIICVLYVPNLRPPRTMAFSRFFFKRQHEANNSMKIVRSGPKEAVQYQEPGKTSKTVARPAGMDLKYWGHMTLSLRSPFQNFGDEIGKKQQS